MLLPLRGNVLIIFTRYFCPAISSLHEELSPVGSLRYYPAKASVVTALLNSCQTMRQAGGKSEKSALLGFAALNYLNLTKMLLFPAEMFFAVNRLPCGGMAVQLPPGNHEATVETQWRSPVHKSVSSPEAVYRLAQSLPGETLPVCGRPAGPMINTRRREFGRARVVMI